LPNGIEGKARYWVWEFEVERDELFLEDGDPVALLKKDLDRVPIIDGLTNSVEITPACFFSSGERQNMWISEIS
jgi:hypothetical protein